MKAVRAFCTIGLALLFLAATKCIAAVDPASSLCPSPTLSVVFVQFNNDHVLGTIELTTGPNGGDVLSFRPISSAQVAQLCTEGFDVRATPLASGLGDYFPLIVEFYRPERNVYFLTRDPTEIHALDTGVLQGWVRTGQQFRAYVTDASIATGPLPLSDVCRFYGLPSFGLDSHFFSAFSDECAVVVQRWPDRWLQETSSAFRVHLPDGNGSCPAGTAPLYRLFNGVGNHRYTTSLDLRQQMLNQQWIAEGYGPIGVAMCVRPS